MGAGIRAFARYLRAGLLTVFFILPGHALLANGFSIAGEDAVSLSGIWAFYPNRLLTGFDLSLEEQDLADPAAYEYVSVPQSWEFYNSLGHGSAQFGSRGAATFSTWLEDLQPGELYAVRLDHASSSHRIYLGDDAQPLCGSGRVGASAEEYVPDFRLVLCRFSATSSRMRLTIQVANFDHALGGLVVSPVAGKEDAIWRAYLTASTLTVSALAFIFGAILLLLLGYLLNSDDKRGLYIAGFACAVSIYILNTGILLGSELFQFYGFQIQTRTSMFLFPFGSAMLMLYVRAWTNSERIKKAALATGVVFLLFAFAWIIMPLAVSMHYYRFNFLFPALLSVFLLGLAIHAFIRRAEHRGWIAASVLLMVATIGVALMNLMHITNLPGIEVYGFLLFLAGETSYGVVELTSVRRRQKLLIQQNKAVLDRLSLFVPREHLKAVSGRWHRKIEPGIHYHTDACIMFLRIEPEGAAELDAATLANLYSDFAEEVANNAQAVNGVLDRISVGRYILSFNDDPAVAMQLAVNLRQQVRTWAGALGRFILFRCGIHYGPAVWGIYGSPERWSGGYLGDSVNVAARLETLCARYRTAILMSQDAYFQSAHFDAFLTRMLEPVKLKGKREHIFVYEVLSGLPEDRLNDIRETLPSFGRGLQAFVNRDFARAVDYFRKVCEANPEDYAARLYLNRATMLLEAGIDEDWNPIEALQKK